MFHLQYHFHCLLYICFFVFFIYFFLFRFQNVFVVRSDLPLSASILFSKCILRNNAQNNVAQYTEKDSAPINVLLLSISDGVT